MIITSLQLLQMVVGCAVNYFAFKFKESGEFLLVYRKMHFSQDFNRFTFCMPRIPIPGPPFRTFTETYPFKRTSCMCRKTMCSQRQQSLLQCPHVFQLLPPLCQVIAEDIRSRGSMTCYISGSSIKPISASQKGKAWKKGLGLAASRNSTELRSALEMSFRPVVNAQKTINHRIKDPRVKKVRMALLS